MEIIEDESYSSENTEETEIPSQELLNKLCNLISSNNKRVSSANRLELFHRECTTRYVFIVSHFLEANTCVKYHACCILEKYLALKFEQITRLIEKKVQSPDQAIEMAKQNAEIEVLVCIWVAAKFDCQETTIKLCNLCQYLQERGHTVKEHDLCTMERNILRTLSFRIHILTPYDYLLWVVRILGCNNPEMNTVNLRAASKKMLDTAYPVRHEIYMSFYRLRIGLECSEETEMEQLNRIKCDYILLACGVITAAAVAFDELQIQVEDLAEKLHQTTRIKKDHIAAFTYSILHNTSIPELR